MEVNACVSCFRKELIEFLFRMNSVAELYTYLPLTPENTKRLKCTSPRSIENNDYGFSVGRGAFHLDAAVGKWLSVAFRIKLNTMGSTNGFPYFSPE